MKSFGDEITINHFQEQLGGQTRLSIATVSQRNFILDDCKFNSFNFWKFCQAHPERMRMEKAITAEQIGSTQKRRNNWIIAEKRSDVNLLNIFAPPLKKKKNKK